MFSYLYTNTLVKTCHTNGLFSIKPFNLKINLDLSCMIIIVCLFLSKGYPMYTNSLTVKSEPMLTFLCHAFEIISCSQLDFYGGNKASFTEINFSDVMIVSTPLITFSCVCYIDTDFY